MLNTIEIIAFVGKAHSGKTYQSDMVVEKLEVAGRAVKKLAFADWLKNKIFEAIGWRKEYNPATVSDAVVRLSVLRRTILLSLGERFEEEVIRRWEPLVMLANELSDAVDGEGSDADAEYIYGILIRKIYQIVGTDILRVLVDPDWHAKKTSGYINDIAQVFDDIVFVIDDMRFDNEYEHLRELENLGVSLDVKVLNPSIETVMERTGKAREEIEEVWSHESEQACERLIHRLISEKGESAVVA